MQRRSGFLTFLSACFPGVGYMYLGLVKKGIQFLALFLLIEPIFSVIGMHSIGEIIKIPLWFYTFFDTFSIARRMDAGEFIPDSDFIFNKYNNSYNNNGDNAPIQQTFKMGVNKNTWIIFAWVLIAVGVVSIINKAFSGYELYELLISYIGTYFIPILFVAGGLYLLYKAKK